MIRESHDQRFASETKRLKYFHKTRHDASASSNRT